MLLFRFVSISWTLNIEQLNSVYVSFQDLWNKFPLICGQLCDKKTCAFVVMRIGKKVESSINFSVCCLNFVPGLQSAFCTDRIGISVFVRASLESGLKYWSWKKILVRLS